ncbi:MAG TPA: ATP-dependent Clp protease adaptor ClpS [Amycolatopsis sp.]|uniref:ATP-dependent Clp protease adaptor ClpS n=1 Tax=Amycolatopsis sp. TaxID=37632 RepID=UPI002B488D86|nr:ATP-dependent Clp protease adaptor ClpS [Amycolatopsis sp.]HKS47262.1 ATP-dependent Clp protease adaptor ClpS [Amycolatopsis sp.]
MAEQRPWAVIVHDDDVNSYAVTAFVVHEVCGLPLARGLELALTADLAGEAELTWCDSREQAEELVARIQVCGLLATVRRGSAWAIS